MAYHLHIPPEQQDRLTVLRWRQAMAAVDSIEAELNKQGG